MCSSDFVFPKYKQDSAFYVSGALQLAKTGPPATKNFLALLGLFPSDALMGNRSFRLQVVSPTSRLAYIEVVSPTRSELFRLHLSRFAYTKYLLLNKCLVNTKYLTKNLQMSFQ